MELLRVNKRSALETNEGGIPGEIVEVVLEVVALTGVTKKTVKIMQNKIMATEMLSFPFNTCK